MNKRTTKLSHDECQTELSLMVDAAYQKYGTHAYSAGYMESMLVTALTLLTKDVQAELIKAIRMSSVLQPE